MGDATPMRGTTDRVSEEDSSRIEAGWADEARASRELGAARRRVRDLEQEVAALKEARRSQAEQYETVLRSTSWRMTRPLRALVMLLRGQLPVAEIARRFGLPFGGGQARRKMRAAGGAPNAVAQGVEAQGELAELAFPLPGRVAWTPELSGEAMTPLAATVSVVIPTYNAGAEFHWLLRKLKAQKGLAGVEVVVVDSDSTDGTAEAAEAAGCVVVRIPNSEFSHSHARNLGADAASGELLLFTVQDAYPVGDHWLYSLARALTAPILEEYRVSALSCSEFPRRDSEMFYNAGIDAHYRFLNCRECDRVGVLTGQAHEQLRAQGQLSDVACLIPAKTFQAYRYEGRYAEDLMLGVRMIRDGHKLAMLNSVQVIHSHNRPAHYHLKRTFVDVLFLIDNFPDFLVPYADNVTGALAAGAALEELVRHWGPGFGQDAGESLWALSGRVRRLPLRELKVPGPEVDFGLPALKDWIAEAIAAETHLGRPDAEVLRTMFADKLESIADYAGGIYGGTDDHVGQEIASAARKTLASTIGAQLAFLYLNHAETGPPELRSRMQALRDLMLAGV